MDRSFRSRMRLVLASLALLAVLLAAVGCAGSAGQAEAPAAPAASAAARDPSGSKPGGAAGEDRQPGAQPAGGSNAGVEGGDGGDGSGSGAGGGPGAAAAFRDLARIVYTGTLALEVDDLEKAVKAGRDAVLATGGYVGASRQVIEKDLATASVTYRIPADQWEESLEALRELGAVQSEEIDSTEVTGQIVDLQARIRNLRVSEAAIQAIAEKATTFEEILDGQARLSSVREEIERLDAQLAALEGQADLGTLTVTFATKPAAPPQPVPVAAEPAWDPREEVSAATGTLVTMLQTLSSVAIWLGIVWLPVLAMVLLVAIAVRVVLRRSRLLERVTEPAAPSVPGG